MKYNYILHVVMNIYVKYTIKYLRNGTNMVRLKSTTSSDVPTNIIIN